LINILAAVILPVALLPTAFVADESSARTANRSQEKTSEPEVFCATGTKLERRRAVVCFEGGNISAAEQGRWADLISSGVDNVEKFLGLSAGSGRLEYVVSDRFGTTSMYLAGPPRVVLSMSRVQDGAAPYLHETVHHVVFRRAKKRTAPPLHLWILEGFPSYVEDAVAEELGGVPGRVFTKGGNKSVDLEASRALSAPFGPEVVKFIGRRGAPANLADRENVAPPFYVMAQSFTKHLIEIIGLRAFVKTIVPVLITSEELEQGVQGATGRSLEQLRDEWLTRISALGRPARSDG
jgi:hypothetical protein